MIVKYDATIAAATLRHSVPGVERVVVARTNGDTFFDDGDAETRDDAARVSAAVSKTVVRSAEWFGLGHTASVTVRAAAGCILLRPLDDMHVLAVVCNEDVNLALLDRVSARVVGELVR